MLAVAIQVLGYEDVGVDLDRMPVVLDAVRLFRPRIRNRGDVHLVQVRHVADALKPEQVVDLLGQFVNRIGQAFQIVFQCLDAFGDFLLGNRLFRVRGVERDQRDRSK
jgi:hypothetical protein